jgi:hypothetical protein
VRCPKCDALAADSDPYCLWCGKRLRHAKSAPRIPGGGASPGGPQRGAGRLAADGVGAVLMVLGMLFGSWVAAGADTAILQDIVKPAIAASICCGFPLVGLLVSVRLLGRRRQVRRLDLSTRSDARSDMVPPNRRIQKLSHRAG